ncbi:MAG: hypothetical protein NTU79_15055 [Planctomycetota bacterium]|nr:hypothetical protein [Planctomycetota bacterium]
MYALLPYLWILFMVGLVVSTIVAVIRSRPKKTPTPKAAEGLTSDGTLSEPGEPILDFGDELAQMK